jgi:hypothetical protein
MSHLKHALDRTGLLGVARSVRRRPRWSKPYWLYVAKNLPRVLSPTTFTDKLRHKMLFDRSEFVPRTADKAGVRAYVAATVGERYLKQTFAVADDPRRIPWASLPREFVCKATHASGGVVLVTDDAPEATRVAPFDEIRWKRMAVRPERVTESDLITVCDGWLGETYGWGSGSTHEWHYARIPKRILVEELLRDEAGRPPIEYRLYVFHGTCAFIQVMVHAGAQRYAAHFRPDWSVLDVGHRLALPPEGVERPAMLAELITVAERLGSETDFVRVDLFGIGTRIAFGELTHFPNAGKPAFDAATNAAVGALWTLPS